MTEENQTPQPQWVTELKEWGIDVEAFDAKWEQAGEESKAEFRDALAKAAAAFEAEKSELKEAVDKAREDAAAFVQKMSTAWDEMVSGIMQELHPESKDNNTAS